MALPYEKKNYYERAEVLLQYVMGKSKPVTKQSTARKRQNVKWADPYIQNIALLILKEAGNIKMYWCDLMD